MIDDSINRVTLLDNNGRGGPLSLVDPTRIHIFNALTLTLTEVDDDDVDDMFLDDKIVRYEYAQNRFNPFRLV